MAVCACKYLQIINAVILLRYGISPKYCVGGRGGFVIAILMTAKLQFEAISAKYKPNLI